MERLRKSKYGDTLCFAFEHSGAYFCSLIWIKCFLATPHLFSIDSAKLFLKKKRKVLFLTPVTSSMIYVKEYPHVCFKPAT